MSFHACSERFWSDGAGRPLTMTAISAHERVATTFGVAVGVVAKAMRYTMSCNPI